MSVVDKKLFVSYFQDTNDWATASDWQKKMASCVMILEKNSREQGKGCQNHMGPAEGNCPKTDQLNRCCWGLMILK